MTTAGYPTTSTMADVPSIGFLGLGIMGHAMASRIAEAFPGKLTVWNRTAAKCEPLKAKGAAVASSIKEVIDKCDITIAITSDPESARALVFGPGGVLEGLDAAAGKAKGFVDMSTVDEDTSKEIAAAVSARGGRYLEAPVSGSKGPAENGQLVILAAGEEGLAKESQPFFDVMGKKTFFLGEVGAGARMKLVVNMVMGINMAALSEGLSMGTKSGLKGEDIISVIKEGAIASPMYGLKGPKMLTGDYATNFPLKHQQKDMRLALKLGDSIGQSMPLAAAANEQYKAARGSGHGDADFSAVHEVVMGKKP